MMKGFSNRAAAILCALALSLGLMLPGAGALAAESPRPIEVWDFTGQAETDPSLYADRVTPAGWAASGALADGVLSNGAEVTFGDLTMTHNANDRIYSAVESPDWGGVLGGNAQNKYGNAYDDGYEALGGWYCNGSGGENRRFITLRNVQAGDKILLYAGSASGDIVFHFDALAEGSDQAETANAAAKEFGKFTFIAQSSGDYKLWTDAAGKAMFHRLIRVPGAAVSGTVTFPADFALTGYTLKFINRETRLETPATLAPDNTFTAVLAPGYTYNAALSGAPGWGFAADTRQVSVSDAEAVSGKAGVALTVEPKSTYTFSGRVVGADPAYLPYGTLRVTLTPEAGSDSEPVELTVGADMAFSGVLDPSTIYTVDLVGANDYQVVSPLEVTGEGAPLTQDVVLALKPTYPVSGRFLGVEPGLITGMAFIRQEDGYVYYRDEAVTADGYATQLRDGAYTVSAATPTGEYTTRTHVVVEGGAAQRDLLFVSSAAKPALAWTADLFVGCPGRSPNYATVSEAVEAAGRMGVDSEAKRVTIHVAPGTYREQVIVDVPYVSLVNADPSKEVLLTWYYGIGYRYYSVGGHDQDGYYDPQAAYDHYEKYPADRWGAAVRVMPGAVGFRGSNLTFENSFNRYLTDEELADGVEPEDVKPARSYLLDVAGKAATERAAALCVEADGAEFYRCKFLSSQDTLYTACDAYFKNCLIEGQTDYVFGSGNVVFDGCELRWKGYSDAETGGYITAARQDSGERGYLFRSCAVTANPDLTVTPGYFGRPWGPDAAVTFQNTALERADLIRAEGWTDMSGNKPENARFAEYRTTADGAPVDTAQRVAGTADAQSALSVPDWLGWTPVYYEEEAPAVTFATDPILTDNGDINLPKPGHTLTAGYSLGDPNDRSDASLIQWYRVGPDGTEALVKSSLATVSRSYQLQQEDAGCRIKVTVTPATLSGQTGQAKSYTLIETVKEGWNDPGAAPGAVELGDGINVFLAGDSTVKDYSAKGMYNDGKNQTEGSWGEFLQAFFDPDQVTVVNYAQGGRSTRNFLNEGSLDKIAEKIGPGDYLFIQFGHNDASNADQSHLTERHAPLGVPDENGVYPSTPGVKQPTPAGLPASWGEECYTWDCGGTYKWYLQQYIDVARAAGATPVLVTPVSRMYYESDGSIRPHHDESTSETKCNAYCAAVRQLAQEQSVLLIDAFALTEGTFTDAYRAAGSEVYGQQTMCVGESTHSNKLGGVLEAALVAGAIQDLGVDISRAVKAPAKVLGETPKGETAFLINAQGKLSAYDVLKDYAESAPYWEGVGQSLFDGIAARAAGQTGPVQDQPDQSQPAPDQGQPAPDQPQTVPSQGGVYTVRRGDSLWRIAQRLYGDGRKYALIFQANRATIADPNRIFVGQVLVIPEG